MITQTSFFGLPIRTPVQRKLLVLLYYVLLLVVAGFGFVRNNRLPAALAFQTFFFAGILGGVRTGGPVKAYTEPSFAGSDDTRPIVLGLGAVRDRLLGPRSWSRLDERETERRNWAHFKAYRLLICLFCAVGLATVGAWYVIPARVLHEAPLLLWMLLMITISLPQAVLLWTEPAPLEP